MALKSIRIGPIRTLDDAADAFQDIQQFLDGVYAQCPATLDDTPGAGLIKVLVKESDGTWHLWSLVAGVGVAFAQDNVNRTLTVSS